MHVFLPDNDELTSIIGDPMIQKLRSYYEPLGWGDRLYAEEQ